MPARHHIGRTWHRLGCPRVKDPVTKMCACEADLTDQQLRILQMLWAGKSRKETAYELGLSIKTVEFHLGNMHRKLGSFDTMSLIKAGLKRGYIQL